MEAFIVHDNKREIIRIGMELQRVGFTVKSCRDQNRSCKHVREQMVDLLVLKQVIDGRYTTSVALSAEFRNPKVATVLLSTRSRADRVEQFDLVPSINAILSTTPNAKFIGSLARQIKNDRDARALVLSPMDRTFAEIPRRVA